MSKPFSETLREIRRGELLAELKDKLVDVVQAVTVTGKAGSLTLTINVKPASKGDTHQLFVDAKVKTKEPEPEKSSTLFFAGADGELLRKDPRQHELDLREVPVTPKPLKEVSNA